MDLTIMVTPVAFLGITLVILGALSQVALWQRKEYRVDRLRAHLTSPLGREDLISWASLAFLIAGAAWVTSRWLPYAAPILAGLALLTLTVHHGQRVLLRGVYRPRFTLKATVLLITTVVLTIAAWFVHPPAPAIVRWDTIAVIVPLIAALSAMLVNVPFALRKRYVIRRSHRHRLAQPRLTVVGITGSAGKSSTKRWLFELLKPAEDVVATRAHRNAAYPVAIDCLEQVQSTTRVYIVEMGAYRRGEIAALARMLKPSIGIITSISAQHLALFGSVEATARTKWELIAALAPPGVAILNADDEHVRHLAALHPPSQVVWFSTEAAADVTLRASHIAPTSMTATLTISGTAYPVTIRLAGQGALSSLVGACAAAAHLGVTPAVVAQRVQWLTPFPRTMEVRIGRNGATIIDDSYSANEAGVVQALEHLQRFPQSDKRVVLAPLIELGRDGPAVHRRIGQLIGQLRLPTTLTSRAYSRDVIAGAQSVSDVPVTVITHPRRLTRVLSERLTPQTAMLLEGRIPERARRGVLLSR